MNITESQIALDISFTAFETAVAHIRAEPNKVTLYVVHAAVCVAYKIKERYNCEIVLIPNELAKTNFCWGVIGNDSMYWSLGV